MGKEILNIIIESSGKTIDQFEKDIGVNVNTIRKWQSGETRPSRRNQNVIRAIFKREIARLYK
jgi:DNA-binding transcriptional regulator YiaG